MVLFRPPRAYSADTELCRLQTAELFVVCLLRL
jgi:hypothetical protein